jgi:nickel-type superoxide dismutase maturation protease
MDGVAKTLVRWWRPRRRWGIAALLGLASLAAASTLLVRCEVEGESMAPTLRPGDHVLLRRRPAWGRLRPGQIVAFVDPRPGHERLVLKRIDQVNGASAWVLGDNRGASTDSRAYGALEHSEIPLVLLRRYGAA